MSDATKEILVTFRRGKVAKTVRVEASILSHMFVAHSLNLHNWTKLEREKMVKKSSESCQRDDLIRSANWLFDALEDIDRRREANSAMEDAYKEALNAP